MLLYYMEYLWQDPEKLDFVENPSFEECFPNSVKMYKELEHNGSALKVRLTAPLSLSCTSSLCREESNSKGGLLDRLLAELLYFPLL